jgi:hypothetical protein
MTYERHYPGLGPSMHIHDSRGLKIMPYEQMNARAELLVILGIKIKQKTCQFIASCKDSNIVQESQTTKNLAGVRKDVNTS